MITAPTFAANKNTYELLPSGSCPRPRPMALKLGCAMATAGMKTSSASPSAIPIRSTASITAGHGDADQERRGNRDRHCSGHSDELAHPGDTGILGEERPDARCEEGKRREERPPLSEGFPNEGAVALVGEDPEADGHLLDDVENWNEHEFGQDHPVTPLRTGLSGRYEAPCISVRKHHDEARTPDGQDPCHKPTTTGAGLSLDQRRGGRSSQELENLGGNPVTVRTEGDGEACDPAQRDWGRNLSSSDRSKTSSEAQTRWSISLRLIGLDELSDEQS